MSSHDSLGDRMKGYERVWKAALPRRMPVILRVDGRAFHTVTRGMRRPFDDEFMAVMDLVAVRLASHIDGAAIGYVQSDEISLLVHTYKRFASMPWFDNEVQKMTSIAASVAAVTFSLQAQMPVEFDARVFVLPEAEVANYFLWRQQDASRNSIQMVARSLYSHKELDHVKTNELQELCHQRGVNWNDIPTHQKRGRCVVKETYMQDGLERSRWTVDREIPIFSQDRDYIERHLAVEPEQPVASTT